MTAKKDWRAANPVGLRKPSFVGKVPVLLIIDMQNDFCHPDGSFSAAGLSLPDEKQIVENIDSIVGTFRSLDNGSVIWTRMEWRDSEDIGILAERSPFLAENTLREGSWGAEVVEGLEVEADDIVLTKRRFDAFYETNLEEKLERLGATDLIFVGVRTDFCVESTVRAAFFRDYNCLVVRDAVSGFNQDLHASSIREMSTVFSQIVSADDLTEALMRAT